MTRRLEVGDLITDDVCREADAWIGTRDEDAVARIAWSILIEPGDGVAGEAIARFGPRSALDRVATAPRGDDIASALDRWASRWDPHLVLDAIAAARRREIRLLVPGEASWPAGLDDLGPHAPVCLWVRGEADAVAHGLSAGLVGARAATGYGEHVAADLASSLAGDDIVIISGAAYGIDGAAHRAAMRVGGRTVAFVAGGADRVYPAGHAHLLQQITERGAVVAECPPGTTPTRWRFLARNRLIAAVSTATVVVEAGGRSGSINTAGHAAALGRPLGAVPGPVTSSTSAGCHRLLREYDAVCVTSAGDARELLGVGPDPQPLAYEAPETIRLADALSRRRARTVDELARRSGLAPADVVATLGLMALAGSAEAREDGWVSAT